MFSRGAKFPRKFGPGGQSLGGGEFPGTPVPRWQKKSGGQSFGGGDFLGHRCLVGKTKREHRTKYKYGKQTKAEFNHAIRLNA
jgi:hypothetical protein